MDDARITSFQQDIHTIGLTGLELCDILVTCALLVVQVVEACMARMQEQVVNAGLNSPSHLQLGPAGPSSLHAYIPVAALFMCLHNHAPHRMHTPNRLKTY